MGNFIRNLEASLHKGFINQNDGESGSFKPKLLINNTKKSENVLTSLLEELDRRSAGRKAVRVASRSGPVTAPTRLSPRRHARRRSRRPPPESP